MMKNLVSLEHTVEGKVIQLFCENDTPLVSLKEALFQFSKYIGQIEDNIRSQQEQAKLESEKASKKSEDE